LWVALLMGTIHAYGQLASAPGVWTKARAEQWYRQQPWLVGCNYTPRDAINQLEMWQAGSFNPTIIDQELGWAKSIGMNTVRIFLHDLLWQQDSTGFTSRMDQFLTLAARHRIKPMFVLFDSVWDPFPQLGQQREPKPGVHNSGWVQSPGAAALQDTAQYRRLAAYVRGVVRRFGQDARVLSWDVWNEPDNVNVPAYNQGEPANKLGLVVQLLPRVFSWARSVNPTQPLTCGVWSGDWSAVGKLKPIERIQLENSDVISFHSYDNPREFEKRLQWLLSYGRPLLCTEYMARGNGSTFEGTLPLAKKYRVAAYNWGFVVGKTQTHLPWDSWLKPYVDREPRVWFHEIFRPDGAPYRPAETALIKRLTEGQTARRPQAIHK